MSSQKRDNIRWGKVFYDNASTKDGRACMMDTKSVVSEMTIAKNRNKNKNDRDSNRRQTTMASINRLQKSSSSNINHVMLNKTGDRQSQKDQTMALIRRNKLLSSQMGGTNINADIIAMPKDEIQMEIERMRDHRSQDRDYYRAKSKRASSGIDMDYDNYYENLGNYVEGEEPADQFKSKRDMKLSQKDL